MPVTATTPGIRLRPGDEPGLAAGHWRVDPALSQASFATQVAGRPVRGCLPLTGEVLIAEPIEESTARLAARTSAISLRGQRGGPGLPHPGARPGAAPARDPGERRRAAAARHGQEPLVLHSGPAGAR